MKKILFVLVAVAALAITACNNNNKPAEVTEDATVATQVDSLAEAAIEAPCDSTAVNE